MHQILNLPSLVGVDALGYMPTFYNRKKGLADKKLLHDFPAVSAAHKAWTQVVAAHQRNYYGIGRLYSQQTPNSIRSKPKSFFRIWEPWSTDAKHAYEQAIAAQGYNHETSYDSS